MDKLKPSGTSFDVSTGEVWEAYRQVTADQGAPGVDGVTVEQFDEDLKDDLDWIWNRLSSGSYFPSPVTAVEIPKPRGGGTRTLGIPTIADRVAQTVVARRLELKVEPIFDPDSYRYRPYRSALDPVGACRERCWKTDWVIDLDIQKFFDSVDHALVVTAVEAHADVRWVVLYVTRWLAAPLALPDGTVQPRDRGTPQGSAVSPVLANLFMHYACDRWMAREYPGVAFQRYADDAVVHCVTERQARNLVEAIGDRMEQVGLRLHPDKTKVVYCQDGKRRLDRELTAFTFLGFTFRARPARTTHARMFVSFQPAISKDAQIKISGQLRRWRLHRRIGHPLADLARQLNPVVRGWMQYYGAFYRSALQPLLSRINAYLMRWIRNKYKRLRPIKKATASWQRITSQHPRLFAHWAWVRGSWWTG